MKSVNDFLSDVLYDSGIEREFTKDMHITTEELGLNSLELVHLSVAIYDEYGVKLKLLKKDNLSLFDVCNEVNQKMIAASESMESTTASEINLSLASVLDDDNMLVSL